MVLVLLVCACGAGPGVCAPSKAAAAKISKLKQKSAKNSAKMQVLKTRIKAKKLQKRNITGQLLQTEAKLDVAQEKLNGNKIRLGDAQIDLKRTTERLERTRKQLNRRRALLGRRVVDIYEGEDVNYVNVVLGASDMWTFLTRTYYLRRILDSDARLIAEIRTYEASIQKDRARQARRVAQIQGLQVELVSQRNEVSDLAEEKRQQLDQVENDTELLQRMLDELERDSMRIEAQIQRIQSTPEGRARLARKFKGGLILPARGRISSRFGYRMHPIRRVYKLHTGVDIACRTGTAVCAAASGVVIMSGWQGAYGKAVVIDHGGGVSTLYGHCSSLLVSVGQQVTQGQTIARSGSTGYSTGPHCHFEKRINGTPVNPL